MSTDWSRRRTLAAVGAALVAGCQGAPRSDDEADGTAGGGATDPGTTVTDTASPTPEPTPAPEPDASFTPREWSAPTDAPTADVTGNVLVENLEIPWDISVASNGDLFLTERVGRVRKYAAGELESVLAPEDAIDAGSVTPGADESSWWVKGGEGGTLGVAVHPDYPEVQLLFVYYTAAVDGGKVNRVSRFDLSAADPAAAETVLVDDIPANNFHNGGRLTFGPRGALWATTGDAGQKPLAADPARLPGSVLRVTVNGEPAADTSPVQGGDPRVFTYGHRNPQGLVFLPDGTVLASEHGPAGRDEVNRLVAGGNYGWPDVRTAEAYADLPADSDVRRPLVNTGGGTTWAPTGSLFYTGDAVPSWRNRMLIGGLASQQLIVCTLTPPGGDLPPVEGGRRFDADWTDDAYTATAHPVLQNEFGRIRHVEQGLDGELYLVTSNRDGRARGKFPRERDDVLVRLEASA